MKRSYDFSKGERGKFYKPYAVLKLPAYLAEKAMAREVGLSELVNELLEKDIELIEAAR